ENNFLAQVALLALEKISVTLARAPSATRAATTATAFTATATAAKSSTPTATTGSAIGLLWWCCGCAALRRGWCCLCCFVCHNKSPKRLKLQSGLARCIRERFDLAVITRTRAVENNFLDAFGTRHFRGDFADGLSAAHIRF